jgi:hypothetical protein
MPNGKIRTDLLSEEVIDLSRRRRSKSGRVSVPVVSLLVFQDISLRVTELSHRKSDGAQSAALLCGIACYLTQGARLVG